MNRILILAWGIALVLAAPAIFAAPANPLNARPLPKERPNPKIALQSTVPGYPPAVGGSHYYEYVSSANINKVSANTLRLDVNVFLVNPGGCTTGNPCVEYDSSPQYVNAWIDWNGDKSWSASEQVMAEAGTGYQSINYAGNMFFTKTVLIPDTATSGTVYCRVMHSWGENITSPTTNSWTWGSVMDIPVTLVNEKPKITDITINPAKNPETESNVTFTAVIQPNVDYQIVKVTWTGPDLAPGEGNPYTKKYTRGKHGLKRVKATLTYKHIASGIIGTTSKEIDFKLFFKKSGDDDADGIPNWFKYWKKDGASPALNNAIVIYDATDTGYGAYDPSTNKVDVGPASAGEHYPSKPVFNGKTYGGAKGIDSIEEVLKHELRHKFISDNQKVGGIWNTLTDTDRSSPTAAYRDDLPDTFEATIGSKNTRVDTFDLEHKKSAIYKFYGDNEYHAVDFANGAKGVAAKDWANPGQQSDPAYKDLQAGIADSGSGIITNLDAYNYYTNRIVPKALFSGWANFVAVNSVTGVNTGGTAKFDVLRANVKIHVSIAGSYKVTAYLSQVGGGPITFARNTATYTVGDKNLDLDFSGSVIEASGLNGPYRISLIQIRTGDEDLNLADVDTNVFTTSAFTANQFEATTAKVLGNGSSAVVSGNLQVGCDIGITIPGIYTISGLLENTTGTVVISQQTITATYPAGTARINFTFPAKEIFYGKSTGPYKLALVAIQNPSQQVVDIKTNVYTTTYYDYTTFGSSVISIDPASFTETPLDANNDLKIDGLLIGFSVAKSSSDEERYVVSAYLSAPNGGPVITEYSTPVSLFGFATTNVRLFFHGTDINASKVNGAYSVSALTLMRESDGTIVDSFDPAYVTLAHNAADFAPSIFSLKPNIALGTRDTNSNGRYDFLDFSLFVNTSVTGQFTAQATLADNAGRAITLASTEHFIDTPTSNGLLQVSFPGLPIGNSQINGPYFVRDVTVYFAGAPDKPVSATANYATTNYKFYQFEHRNSANLWDLYE